MSTSRRFCYTLDVLTDGSEHTGCGTLFLSVWKIPLSIQKVATSAAAAEDDDSDSGTSDSGTSDSGASDSSSLCIEDESNGKKPKPNPKHQNSIDEIPNDNNPDIYSWLIGSSNDDDDEENPSSSTTNVPSEEHTPIARYAISGFGDATARLCADQRFKLKPIRACFVPERGFLARTSDGLSALFLAVYGAGVPSLHLVVPSPSSGNRVEEDGSTVGGGGGGFVEELATIILGKHKNLDIQTCEVREPDGNDESVTSPTWWKVYEDDHLIVHACSSKGFLSPPVKGSSFEGRDNREQQMEEGFTSTTSLVYLYSFPIAQLENNKGRVGKNSYCTLALLPPKFRDVEGVYERLMRQNLPMVGDDIPMSSIDYVLFMDPTQSLSSSSSLSLLSSEKDKTKLPSSLPKCSRILMTSPRNYDNPQQNQEVGERSDRGVLHDEGILIRSQQLHRHFHRSMPWAFADPLSKSFHTRSCPNTDLGTVSGRYFVLKSGTSIVLEKNAANNSRPQYRIWDRRKSIWKKELKEEWTKPTLDSLQSFLVGKHPQVPSTTPTAVTDENEIELDDESEAEEEEDSKEQPPTIIEDENEIDLDDEDDNESLIEEEESNSAKNLFSSEPAGRENVPEKNNCSNGETDQNKRNNATRSNNGPRLVVLGTGSATPSAYRGASGYALILPSADNVQETHRTNRQQNYCGNANAGLGLGRVTEHGCEQVGDDQIYLLDCGEGVSTMLSRNCGHLNDWTRRVRGIWISHAHLDHYGGLPTLLRLLCKERKSVATTIGSTAEQRIRKRPRHSANETPALFGSQNRGNTTIPVPWVVAPVKVLQYLDLVLDCHHGRSKDGTMICFEPRLHHDPRLPLSGGSSPFFHFENLRVHHNCCPAFGLLVGWKRKNNISGGSVDQFLCYSGDTRPSQNLVRCCNRALQQQQCHTTSRLYKSSNRNGNRNNNENNNYNNADLFLIHEATFRDAESAMAYQKKHSTIGEARMVATDIPGCSRVLMSHFSQRYDNVAVLPGTTTTGIGSANVNANANCASGGSINSNRNNSNSRNDDNANITFEHGNKGPPSIGLAVDGLWINLD